MILYPIKKGILVQPFGANAEFYSQNYGIKAHNGIDIVSFHGDSILCSEDGLVVKIWNTIDSSITHGFGVYVLGNSFDMNGCQTLYIYWHTMSDLQCAVNQSVKQGDTLAFEGQSGGVYVAGVKVPDSQIGVAPFPGTHLHWGNIKVKKVPETKGQVLANQDGSAYKTPDGFFLEFQNYDNGFRGCVDPMLNDIIYYPDWITQQVIAIAGETNDIAVQLPEPQKSSLLMLIASFLDKLLTWRRSIQ